MSGYARCTDLVQTCLPEISPQRDIPGYPHASALPHQAQQDPGIV